MAYIKGSLINVDLDGDGVYDGFSFRLRNPPVPMAGKVIRMELFIDGEPVDSSKIYINIERKLVRVSDISPENPLTFTPGTRSIFMIFLGRGLEEGVHRIQIRSWLEGFEQVWIPFEFEDEVESDLADRMERARRALRAHTLLWRAHRAQDHAQVLERAAALIAVLPGYSRSYDFREESAGVLEARAETAERDGSFDRAISELELIAEVFNLFDNENWRTTRTELVNRYGEIRDDFGAKTDPGDPRQYQVGLKFRF